MSWAQEEEEEEVVVVVVVEGEGEGMDPVVLEVAWVASPVSLRYFLYV